MAAFDELYPQAAKGFPGPEGAQFTTVEMRPGSVLFMPRGTWHRTEADEDSFSVSIILRPPAAVEALLDQLRWLLLQDPRWRRPLYGARGDEGKKKAARQRLKELLGELPGVAAALSEDDLASPSPAERLAGIGRATRFQRDPRARMEGTKHTGAERLSVRAWDLEQGERVTLQLEVPPKYSAALHWLAESSAAFSAGEVAARFPEISFEEHQKILVALTRARFLRLLWFRPLPGCT